MNIYILVRSKQFDPSGVRYFEVYQPGRTIALSSGLKEHLNMNLMKLYVSGGTQYS